MGLVGLSLKEIARYAEESAVKAELPSLVTEVKGNAHKPKKRPACPDRLIFQEISRSGAWRFMAKPCDRWVCEPCYSWRVETELIPELAEALEWAKELGEVLKFLTLTYSAEDMAAAFDDEGKQRRRLDLAHFAQRLRRKGYTFEYLKVVETHKSGKVHLHLAVIMPFIPQEALSAAWLKCTRRTSRVVHVEAMSWKCPRCWPGPKATAAEKKWSMIVPPPGRGECLCCGYRPDWQNPDVGMQVAKEISKEVTKYLAKELASEGVVKNKVKKLTRSRGWARRCAKTDESLGPVACGGCGGEHRWQFVGKVETLIREGAKGAEQILKEHRIAFYPLGGEPSLCWDQDVTWVESSTVRWDLGLKDYAELGVGGGAPGLQGQLGLEGLRADDGGGGGGAPAVLCCPVGQGNLL